MCLNEKDRRERKGKKLVELRISCLNNKMGGMEFEGRDLEGCDEYFLLRSQFHQS